MKLSEASSDSGEFLTTPDSSFVRESYFNANDDYLDRLIKEDSSVSVFENDDNEMQYSVPHPVNAMSHTFVSDESMLTEVVGLVLVFRGLRAV